MDAEFIMPDFLAGYDIYKYFYKLTNEYPEILIPNSKIYTIFGIFDNCLWNGGGYFFGNSIRREQAKEIIDFYNYELKIPLTFTFTNPMLKKQHYEDTYSNMIAEVGHNGKNCILVSDLEFEKYLRNTYPNYKYCRSIIATEYEPYALSSKYGPYAISVMQRKKNNDWKYLDTIPITDRQFIEFLCNDTCPDNCPRLYSHYKVLGQEQIEFTEQLDGHSCTMKPPLAQIFPYYYITHNLKTYISRRMIDEEYLPRGFCKFKCSGRGSSLNIIVNILDYLIKDEYRIDVLGLMLSHIMS